MISTSIEDTFLRMLDELSPYFGERMRDLDATAARDYRHSGPIEHKSHTNRDSKKARIAVNTVNVQLATLNKMDMSASSPNKAASLSFMA